MNIPARYLESSAEGQARDNQSSSSSCPRCQGYLIHDYFLDPYSTSGEFAIAILRCVQCGSVLDPVIVANRRKSEHAAA